MDHLDQLAITYYLILFIFIFYCYLNRKYLKEPKYNVPWAEDPCIMHQNEKKENFVAKRDPRSKFKSNKEQHGLRTFTEVPYFLQGNIYIVDGYRFDYSFMRSLISLFEIHHNEFWNVWSHLGGFLLFFYFMIKGNLAIMTNDFVGITFLIYLIGAQILFIISGSFHLFQSIGRNFYTIAAKLDYTAISIMITTSCYSPFFHLFRCNTNWAFFYLTSVTVGGILTVIVSWLDFFQTPRYIALRGILFLGYSLITVMPLPHAVYLTSFEIMKPVFIKVFFTTTLYAVGAVLYILRVPEKFSPSKYDNYLNSHFIFHFNVVFASYIHYVMCSRLPQWSEANLLSKC
eukprot:TRINITY_DN3920_c0_g1_i2.p1 TRINITY_DN3920_c0_g1~~TRINITY_DN3920_c0_g1_i2.p1  ORF type:complete len:344 (+),score=33.33 TRINITY_DN3920_c0_g1_i2:114-1145(+)